MGVCESGVNSKETNMPSDTSQMIPEKMIKDPCVAYVSKALCFVRTPNTLGSGFLIKLFKGDQNFFCLITCEHVITREMVNQRAKINFFYDSLNRKSIQIILNPEERIIKDFRNHHDIKYDIDAIVIEILPKDNISSEFFLEPDINNIYNFKNLENKEIAIVRYPKSKLSYAYGTIKEIYETRNHFVYFADTEEGLSGSPIFLKNSIQVIGIHKEGISNENYGEFIGPIFEYFKNFTVKKEPWNKGMMNKNLNQMTIIYNVDKNENGIKIFGEDFVKNNKNNCYLIINGKQRELCDYLNMNEIKIENNQLKIKLIENKHITNMGSIFYYCSSLISLPDISKWNTANVTNMGSIFYYCRSLVSLPDISKWNTANVTNMSCMFYYCSSLKSFPDISKWNTANVTNMSCMFYYCSSLKSFPDISKWNTTNVTDMCGMFYNCSSLISFPDISKWKLNKELNKEDMFNGCDERIIPEKFKSYID